jgi:E3 ubiquitin-protein ligase DOA10
MIKEPDIDLVKKHELVDEYLAYAITRTNPLVAEMEQKKMEEQKVTAKDIEDEIKKSGLLAPNRILEAIDEKEKANQPIGECKAVPQEEVQAYHNSYNSRQNNRNRVFAIRILTILGGDIYSGYELNSFEKEVIALCKTQL